jgi:malate synthase
VVPVSNPRYALNAANARWVSLYDALMAPRHCDRSKRQWLRPGPWCGRHRLRAQVLDEIAPLLAGSHADVASYSVQDAQLRVQLADGYVTSLLNPARFVAWRGTPAQPSTLLLRNNGLHLEIVLNRAHRIGKTDAGIATWSTRRH